jgi:glucokinase
VATPGLLAVDVGGTQIKVTVLDADPAGGLTVLDRAYHPTPQGADGTATARAVVAAVAALAAEHAGVRAVGVVVPGLVHDGVGVYSANLGWRDFPFVAELTERIGLPVALGHDVAACGLAEHRLGAARGYRQAVVMPIGTGIAAALIMDGAVRTGDGYGGEVGHVDVGHDEPCRCGQTGCLEMIASSPAIARRYAARTGRTVPGAAEVVAAAEHAVARALRMLATLLGPEVVVLGGGVAQAGARLVEPVTTRLAESLTFQRMPALRLAELGYEAGSLGAGLLARDLLEGAR